MKTFAMLGYGYWGKNLLRVMDGIRDINVKYVCDPSDENLAKAKEKYPDYQYIKDYSIILKDKDVDAVVIATPIDTHYSLALQAIEAGKDVFIEKPMTHKTSDAENLVKVAKEHKSIIMTGHTFLFSPPVRKVKEIIDRGELGDIYFITSSRVNLGIHRKNVSVIWDLAPHDLSIISYWLGSEEPTDITVSGRDSVIEGIPDVAFISLKYPSNVIANIELSWLSPTKMRKTTVVGSNKMLIYDDIDPAEKIRIFDKGIEIKDPETYGEYQLTYRTGDVYSPRLDNAEPLKIEFEEFLDAVVTRKTPISDGDFGLKVVRTIEEADSKLYKSL